MRKIWKVYFKIVFRLILKVSEIKFKENKNVDHLVVAHAYNEIICQFIFHSYWVVIWLHSTQADTVFKAQHLYFVI